ncbi:MAG: response regulator [Rhodoferax sp.]|nr:response regulator [Rhodoferax sp.]
MQPRHSPITKETVFLVVDDLEPMRKVTAGQLHLMGINTILTASNGLQALQLLRSHKVDIILSDWNMPVMSGLELLQAVRTDPKLSHLPFIMITAETERIRIEEAIANGVTALLIKPYSGADLIMRVERALSAPPHVPPVTAAKVSTHLRASPNALDAAAPGNAKVAHPTILVIDDSPENLLLMSHLFKDEYRVRVGNSGSMALEICQSNNPPDLVLLDIMMPGIDGFEVARRMREHPVSQTIPVIFVTAMTDKAASLKGFELGAVDFVTKPIDPDVLKPRVRNFMRYVALRKQMQFAYDNALELARLHEDVEQMTRHDLKGPLAGVIGLAQKLAVDESMSRNQITQLRMIEDTSLQLLGMVNLSAELFKIETGRFTLDAQPVKVGDILHRIVDIARSTFAAKHIVVSLEADGLVGTGVASALGDAMLCYSLFQNLLQNACEASPEGGAVVVALRDETPLLITIENRGAVPAAIRERFFDKFATLGKPGGTGLGTYSARLLAQAQNGTVTLAVSDEQNKTTLAVTLPRAD